LSVAYVASNSRTQMPSVHEFGMKVPHLRCDSHTSFKVKRSKVGVTTGGGIPCQLNPVAALRIICSLNCMHAIILNGPVILAYKPRVFCQILILKKCGDSFYTDHAKRHVCMQSIKLLSAYTYIHRLPTLNEFFCHIIVSKYVSRVFVNCTELAKQSQRCWMNSAESAAA